jgi:hypothetical protein
VLGVADGRFALSLVRETNGRWTVDLAEWFNSPRRELLFQAEAETRKALKSDCTREGLPQAIPTSRK